jgi:hypothetical protein
LGIPAGKTGWENRLGKPAGKTGWENRLGLLILSLF